MEITEQFLKDNGFISKDITIDLFGENRPFNCSYVRLFNNSIGNRIIVAYKPDTNWLTVCHKENSLCYVSITVRTVEDMTSLFKIIGITL